MKLKKRRVHLDANVILRYLLTDDPKQSAIAADIFDRAQSEEVRLIVSSVILLEVFYVLSGAYKLTRQKAAEILLTLVSSRLVYCENIVVISDTLNRIISKKVSFGDAYLAASAVHKKEPVASFDHHLTGFDDVEIFSVIDKP